MKFGKDPLQHGHTGVVMLFQRCDTGIDLFLRGFGAEAEADDTAGNLFGKIQCCDDMTGLALMAGRTGGNADVLPGKVVDDVLAGPADQRDGENMGGGSVGNQLQIRDQRELLDGIGLDLRHVCQLFGQSFLTQLHGFCESGNLSGGFRAASSGLGAAVFFGLIVSLIAKPRDKGN